MTDGLSSTLRRWPVFFKADAQCTKLTGTAVAAQQQRNAENAAHSASEVI